LVLFGSLFSLANWRFGFLQPDLPLHDELDRGFRLDTERMVCRNDRLELGQSPGFIGPCGVLSKFQWKGSKVKNREAIGITFRNSNFEDFFFEWFGAQWSFWINGTFADGEMREVDFRDSLFKKVIFRNVKFEGTRWIGARFEDCTFLNSTFHDNQFRGAVFVRTKFKNVTCTHCDFRSAKFQDSVVDGVFSETTYNENSVFPFPIEEAGQHGFEYRQ
jgi:hypothetical protein